jgi:hypothetical protein
MDKISVDLPMQAWNVILTALAQRPYIEVAELMMEIKRQGEAAIKVLAEEKSEAEDKVVP